MAQRRNNWDNEGLRARGVGRRAFLGAFFCGIGAFGLSGCALVDKFSSKKDKNDENFADDEKDAFETERDNHNEMAEYVSKTGRGGKEKREVSRGETFLLSDKAREIYANTER